MTVVKLVQIVLLHNNHIIVAVAIVVIAIAIRILLMPLHFINRLVISIIANIVIIVIAVNIISS